MNVRTSGLGRSGVVAVVAATACTAVALAPRAAGADDQVALGGATGAYQLTATDQGAGYAPTFTGNGYMAVRVPPAGQGYLDGTVPAQSEVAGFYAKTGDQVQQRVNTPTWSTFTFSTGGKAFTAGEGTTGWHQQLDLHTGTITTTARWTAPNGHVTDLRYVVATDRARPGAAVVRLELTPRWSGTATVTDLLDGTPADQSTGVAKGWDTAHRQVWETVVTNGLHVTAGLASTVDLGHGVHDATVTPVAADKDQSAGQRLAFPVTAGAHYALTKYVGVSTSHEAKHPDTAARHESSEAARRGYPAFAAENAQAWASLWRNRIDVLGNEELATQVNASQFYLWSSTRAGVDWSVSPAGLSSNGYGGHIFWDAETWMYPALLAQHPDVAAGMNNYRFDRLEAAKAHAGETGFTGARFPWESALDGTEQIPPPVEVNSEGLYEQHITADIALAHWQYYLATGDRHWLRTKGWPVLSLTARFWAGRAHLGADGRYHIKHVTGPDEENPDVDDEAYTNVGAAATLRMATSAARVLGLDAPASWARIADHLGPLYDPATDTHPEFASYQGQMVKQADVTMLQYPWAYPMPAATARNDIDYYVPRSDPGGPSMDDAINLIDTAALRTPGCASSVYTQRSIEPFMRDVFRQFSETRDGGAFTFMTGIGGFLQEFLYGYTGLRWTPQGVKLAPSLSGGLSGIVLHGMAWHGSRFTVTVGSHTTRLALESGNPVPVDVEGHTVEVGHGHPLVVATQRPDRTPTDDVIRCQDATASSAHPGAVPLAAVDGSPATQWQPDAVPATLVAPLSTVERISSATVLWGRQWPEPPGPNKPPAPGPVVTVRASDYALQVSLDGHAWKTVAEVHGASTATLDELSFPPTRARYVRVAIAKANGETPPLLQELTVKR